jgi:hypothetical protein
MKYIFKIIVFLSMIHILLLSTGCTPYRQSCNMDDDCPAGMLCRENTCNPYKELPGSNIVGEEILEEGEVIIVEVKEPKTPALIVKEKKKENTCLLFPNLECTVFASTEAISLELNNKLTTPMQLTQVTFVRGERKVCGKDLGEQYFLRSQGRIRMVIPCALEAFDGTQAKVEFLLETKRGHLYEEKNLESTLRGETAFWVGHVEEETSE